MENKFERIIENLEEEKTLIIGDINYQFRNNRSCILKKLNKIFFKVKKLRSNFFVFFFFE